MIYVVVFVAGAIASGAAIGIWYYARFQHLTKTKQSLEDWRGRLEASASALKEQNTAIQNREQQHNESMVAFETKKVQYDGLLRENNTLKQDLFNLSVQLKKTQRDQAAITQRQEDIDQKATELAAQYLKENVSWIAAKLTSNNYSSSKNRLLKVIERCRGIRFDVPDGKEQELLQDLKKEFEKAVRADLERQEQARIKARIREEQRLEREIQKQIEDAERERAAIEVALEKALKETMDEHSAEVEHLRAKLKEAEAKAQRAKSRAEMTKAGHVYVISNIGSFGEGVFKIGMTRRDDPRVRVRELGDASVPFPFDVHMMISCDDAPSLENALHRELHKQRVNRVNFRKEFFRVDIDSLRSIVERNHGEVDHVADPEALQYRESLEMTDEDYEFVEETVQSFMDDQDDAGADE